MKPLFSEIDSSLLQRAQLLERMTASARSRLPRHLAAHCWIGNYDASCITLITDNPGFATPIYYQQQEILKQLNEEFGTALGCRFRKVSMRVSRFPIPAAAAPTRTTPRGDTVNNGS